MDEFVEKIKAEEEYDKKLSEIAKKCINLLDEAETSDRASTYWKIGDLIHRLEESLPPEHKRESYQKRSNYLDRLADKIKESAGTMSMRYIRSIYKYSILLKLDEIDDRIPWSIQFEFMELGKDKKAWEHYSNLYLEKKLTEKMKIRHSINEYKKSKKIS